MHKQIDKMSFKQLQDHYLKVEKLLLERKEEEKQKIKAKAEALVAKSGYGFTLTDIMGIKQKRAYTKSGKARKKHTSKIKIVNPANPDQVYRGMGRKPGWLVEMEASQ